MSDGEADRRAEHRADLLKPRANVAKANDKRFRNPRPCPGGCGESVLREGVCGRCFELMRLGQAAIEADQRAGAKVSVFDWYAVIEEAEFRSVDTYEARKQVFFALAALVLTRRRVGWSGDNPWYEREDSTLETRQVKPPGYNRTIDARIPRSSHTERGDYGIICTDEQHEALRWVLDTFGGWIDQAYLRGVEEGRSLIRQLADNEIKTRDLDAHEIKLGRALQRAARRAAGVSVGPKKDDR